MFGFFKKPSQPKPQPQAEPQPKSASEPAPQAGAGLDAASNVQFLPMEMAFVISPMTPEQMRARAEQMARNTWVQALTEAIHAAHKYEPTLADPRYGDSSSCPACNVCREIIDGVRGNRSQATWQPTDDDVRLIYESYKRWLLSVLAVNAPGV